MAVILDGRIEQTGMPQSVFDNPANDRVAGFLGRSTVIPRLKE
jgi:ABC-type Fe3+/spermidine/putrescine transport system ATPase subunit